MTNNSIIYTPKGILMRYTPKQIEDEIEKFEQVREDMYGFQGRYFIKQLDNHKEIIQITSVQSIEFRQEFEDTLYVCSCKVFRTKSFAPPEQRLLAFTRKYIQENFITEYELKRKFEEEKNKDPWKDLVQTFMEERLLY